MENSRSEGLIKGRLRHVRVYSVNQVRKISLSALVKKGLLAACFQIDIISYRIRGNIWKTICGNGKVKQEMYRQTTFLLRKTFPNTETILKVFWWSKESDFTSDLFKYSWRYN